MHNIDWIILLLFLAWTVWDGMRLSEKTESIEGFMLAGRKMPWSAVGLSIMATHASAITFIGTTGKAYVDDMSFLQVYLGLPFAMVILSVTLVPYFNRTKAFTAYESLERRFGLHTRLFTSFLFLIGRGLALGTVVAAPSYVLAELLGMEYSATALLIGVIATVYTLAGGMGGVIRTDVKQMIIMMFALVFCFGWIVSHLPTGVSIGDSLAIAGVAEKLNAVDLSFDLTERYNVWSGVIAGIFLMLSYFGCDQTQVQRYLTAKSVSDARRSLLMSAFAKVPMQFFILLLGVFLWVFYVFVDAPLTFRTIDESAFATEYIVEGEQLRADYVEAKSVREAAALGVANGEQVQDEFARSNEKISALRQQDAERIAAATGASFNDTNYILPWFILNNLPVGIVGLIIAGIFAAALSSIDSALNSLASVSIIDWYKRLHKQERSDKHYLRSSRVATFLWGMLATSAAIALGQTNSIIELVNQIGSYFYGSILGVFMLLLFVKRATPFSAFTGLLLGMLSVFVFDNAFVNAAGEVGIYFSDVPDGFNKLIEYLWLNPVGTGVVVLVGWLFGKRSRS